MATFFGEIILPSSRAFFDDKDESDDESEDWETSRSRKALQVKVNPTSLNCSYDFLIISDGTIARDFVNNYIEGDKTTIADYHLTPDQECHDETEMIYSKKLSRDPVRVATVYKLNSSTLYLETLPSLQLKDVNQLTLHVADWMEKCSEVFVIGSRPQSDYRSDLIATLPQSFVRSLTTSSHQLPSSASLLEQPNFISGISASVMSWCEVKRVKCTLHVCYTDSLFSDSAALSPLVAIMSSTVLSPLLCSKSPNLLRHNNPLHLNIMYQ